MTPTLDSNVRLALVLASTVSILATAATFWPRICFQRASSKVAVSHHVELRKKLPQNLFAWRASQDGTSIWEALRSYFSEAKIELWHDDTFFQRPNKDHVLLSSGFTYVSPVREDWIISFRRFSQRNNMIWMGTTREGHNVAIRVVSVHDEGKEHMRILRKIARGDISLLTENHVVPLWGEFEIEDITFAMVPFIGYTMRYAYGAWAKNSVGDIVDMIIQALEALAFLHSLGIAHRDADKDNYLVPWHPESLTAMRVPICRPRVFINDFETAHEFPPHTPEEECRLTGLPGDKYVKDVPPEVAIGPYDPFKVDVWQLAHSFSDFESTVAEIDELLEMLRIDDPALRPSAAEGRDKLAAIVHGLPPISLLIPPVIYRSDFPDLSPSPSPPSSMSII